MNTYEYGISDYDKIHWLTPDDEQCKEIMEASHFNDFELAAKHIGVIMHILNENPQWKYARQKNKLCMAMHIYLFSMETFFDVFHTIGIDVGGEIMPYFFFSQKGLLAFKNHLFQVDFPTCSNNMPLVMMTVQCAALTMAAVYPDAVDRETLDWLTVQAFRADEIMKNASKDLSSPIYKFAAAKTLDFLNLEMANEIRNANIEKHLNGIDGNQIMERLSSCPPATSVVGVSNAPRPSFNTLQKQKLKEPKNYFWVVIVILAVVIAACLIFLTIDKYYNINSILQLLIG